MKAITVKFIPPTNTRGARLKAYDMDNNFFVIPYPGQSTDREKAYRRAAEGLRHKMGWTGKMVSGGTKEGAVFVFLP